MSAIKAASSPIGDHAQGYFAQSLHDAALALVADGEDVYALFFWDYAVQCDITRASLGDHKLAQIVWCSAPNQGMSLQD